MAKTSPYVPMRGRPCKIQTNITLNKGQIETVHKLNKTLVLNLNFTFEFLALEFDSILLIQIGVLYMKLQQKEPRIQILNFGNHLAIIDVQSSKQMCFFCTIWFSLLEGAELQTYYLRKSDLYLIKSQTLVLNPRTMIVLSRYMLITKLWHQPWMNDDKKQD